MSPMNTAAGGALYHKNPSPPPKSPAEKISNLAGSGHVMHVQILGEVDASDRVGNDAQGRARDHHRHDRQTI